jgi:3-deoxy-D-manno-octulosonic-acid transferase
VIAWRVIRHGRYRQGLAEKLFGRLPGSSDQRPIVWFHAVSVGEVIQLQKVVEEFRRQTENRFSILVSTSTDTGWDLIQKRFPDCQLTWFPLDFTWSVRNAILRVQPALVVLMELELWPNFLMECDRRSVPVAVINARMSERSYRGYCRVRSLLSPIFRRLTLVASQSQEYADRLQSLGVLSERIRVTGSIKFDGVETSRLNPRTSSLREFFQIGDAEIVLMAGSTQEPEEQFVFSAWRELRTEFPGLRLILVPRHKERFDEVAEMVSDVGFPLLRRSSGKLIKANNQQYATFSPVLVLDTIGELSACWGLADIAFVGGSFGNRGGQNMIEPAAYGACVMFGPNTWNFRDVVEGFRNASACLQLQQPDQLTPTIRDLLNQTDRRNELGKKAQSFVQQQQGATQITANLLREVVNASRKV